jgi:hypothetical protein
LEAVEYATLEWVDWFNNRRLLEPIGHVPPAEAEAAYYAALEKPAALAAWLKPTSLREIRHSSQAAAHSAALKAFRGIWQNSHTFRKRKSTKQAARSLSSPKHAEPVHCAMCCDRPASPKMGTNGSCPGEAQVRLRAVGEGWASFASPRRW